MASFNITPDFRRRRKDGNSQLTVFIYHHGMQRAVPIGIYVKESQWDKAAGLANSRHPQYRALNIHINRARLAVEEALLFLPLRATMEEVLTAVKGALFPEEMKRELEKRNKILIDVARRFASMKMEDSTRKTYERTITHIERFRPEATLEDVTRAWLMKFDAHMALSAPSANARAIHMRNLRAVFNYAIDEGLTVNYPFRKFKIKTVETAKRSLTVEQMRELLTMPVEDWQRQYRDFFALSFFLIGTNAKDILNLGPNADKGGRIEFNRAKTKKLYSIRVEEEALEIINRYRGVNHLLNVMDNREDYLQYIRQCNHALKLLGTVSKFGSKTTGTPLFPEISTYWARHTWATLAAELDIPKETIAASLGHDMGNKTSAIYIRFNRDKVDEANRRVIDYVLKGVK